MFLVRTTIQKMGFLSRGKRNVSQSYPSMQIFSIFPPRLFIHSMVPKEHSYSLLIPQYLETYED